MRLARRLPQPVYAAAGEAAGALAFQLIAERRRVTRINLARCLPELSPQERERLARAHFRAFGRAFAERAHLWWGTRAQIEALVRVKGLEHLRGLAGRPAVLFAPHFVGLDAGFARLALELPMVSMYARQKNRAFDRLLYEGRMRFGDQRLVSRQEGVRPLLAALRAGRPLYYLPDQDYGPRGSVFVPFFGVPAATTAALGRLARLAGAAVLPCVTRMLGRGEGYEVHIEPPWDNFPGEDARADARRMNAYIEARVREMPEQYHWMHKRFKTRPPGEARFY